jgi:hypothetical protein
MIHERLPRRCLHSTYRLTPTLRAKKEAPSCPKHTRRATNGKSSRVRSSNFLQWSRTSARSSRSSAPMVTSNSSWRRQVANSCAVFCKGTWIIGLPTNPLGRAWKAVMASSGASIGRDARPISPPSLARSPCVDVRTVPEGQRVCLHWMPH